MNTLTVIHDFLRRQVQPGACCIDATAGKGRDTALLCRLAGEQGRVLAFDIQADAIRQTRALLAAEGLHAEVVQDSHANTSGSRRTFRTFRRPCWRPPRTRPWRSS